MADREDSKGIERAREEIGAAMSDWVEVDGSLRSVLALLDASEYTDKCDELTAAKTVIRRAMADFSVFCAHVEQANMALPAKGGAQ